MRSQTSWLAARRQCTVQSPESPRRKGATSCPTSAGTAQLSGPENDPRNKGARLWVQSDVGLAAIARALTIAGPTDEERRIQAGIDATMRGVIADPRKDPTAQGIPPPSPDQSAKAATGTGLEHALLVIPPKRREEAEGGGRPGECRQFVSRRHSGRCSGAGRRERGGRPEAGRTCSRLVERGWRGGT